MRFLVGVLVLVLAAPVSALDFFSSKPDDSSKAAPVSSSSSSLEQRVQMLERRINTISNIVIRLDTLQQEMQQLRGDLELQTHEVERLKQIQADMDQRMSGGSVGAQANQPLDATAEPTPPASATADADATAHTPQMSVPSSEPNWESSPAPGQSAGTTQSQQPAAGDDLPPVVSSTRQPDAAMSPGQLQTTSVTMAPSRPTYQEAEGEKASYQQAFNLLMDRKYEQAQQAFRSFLSQYPRSRLADNAQYWLAESNYVTRNFSVALTEFNKVVQGHPNSPKVSDALLKVGYIQYEQKQWSAARETLGGVMRNYPNTTASQLAKKRLQQMQALGR
jgi:tol-pal system protein YbgF